MSFATCSPLKVDGVKADDSGENTVSPLPLKREARIIKKGEGMSRVNMFPDVQVLYLIGILVKSRGMTITDILRVVR